MRQNSIPMKEDNFDDYAINMDTYCVHNDIDEYDLFGERTIDENKDNFGDDLDLS